MFGICYSILSLRNWILPLVMIISAPMYLPWFHAAAINEMSACLVEEGPQREKEK